jgi:hypothetical protein
MKRLLCLLLLVCFITSSFSQQKFNGIDVNMGNIFRLSDAKSHSIIPENFTGEKGKGVNGYHGHRCRPCKGPGANLEAKPKRCNKSQNNFYDG